MNASRSSKPKMPSLPTRPAAATETPAEKLEALANADEWSAQPLKEAISEIGATNPTESPQEPRKPAGNTKGRAKAAKPASAPETKPEARPSIVYPWQRPGVGGVSQFSTRIPMVLNEKIRFLAVLNNQKIVDFAIETLSAKVDELLAKHGIK